MLRYLDIIEKVHDFESYLFFFYRNQSLKTDVMIFGVSNAIVVLGLILSLDLGALMDNKRKFIVKNVC